MSLFKAEQQWGHQMKSLGQELARSKEHGINERTMGITSSKTEVQVDKNTIALLNSEYENGYENTYAHKSDLRSLIL